MLRKYRPKIVAVTGSVGKTSTKDAIFAVMARVTHVRKSEKSFNSEIGLPLTILGLENAWGNPLRWLQNIFDGILLILLPAKYPEWLVLEVGADRPGDIRSLVGWLPVDIAVITRLPETPVHVEFFDSPEAVVEEKAALIECLRPGGTLLLYADDARVRALVRHEPAQDAKVLLFGFGEEADIRASGFALVQESGKHTWPIGMQANIALDEDVAPVEILGSVGPHAFLPGIAAAAVGAALGLSLQQIVEGLAGYQSPPGRMRLVPGIKGSLIIDDTYNSSPAALEAALRTLGEIKTKRPGRRVAVLGDMLELGRRSVEEHRKAGVEAAGVCDLLMTVGFRARDIAQGALDSGLADGNILQYEDSGKAGEEIKNMIGEGDCVLVKGSQSVRMERVVEELLLEPEHAADLLVRQDAEWKRR